VTTIRLDSNVKICFITAGEAKTEVLRELYPTRDIGCFIKKPVTIDRLVRRVKDLLGGLLCRIQIYRVYNSISNHIKRNDQLS
jgi:two-component SAPR family response regulator